MCLDGVFTVREQPLRLPHPALAHVRVHDQLYLQVEATAREVHDEQRARELHHFTGSSSNVRLPVVMCPLITQLRPLRMCPYSLAVQRFKRTC